MATLSQSNPYSCDQCGTGEIVAVPLLYQQGTRTFSSTFSHGTSQSHSAQIAAPPHPRGYIRPFVLWGFAIFFFVFWGGAGLSKILAEPSSRETLVHAVGLFLVLGIGCLAGVILNLRRTARYNREIYPHLHWNWAHTYMCRRCGKTRLIPSE
jgi:hypothetical protein